MFDTLLSPMKIGTLELKNRMVCSAAVTRLANSDGTVTEGFIRYHEDKAKGGWGLTMTEDIPVLEHCRTYERLPGLWEDSQIESHRTLTERIHAAGGRIGAQIYHAGRTADPNVNGCRNVAPSSVRGQGIATVPRALTEEEIGGIVAAFGQAARRAKEAGYDLVEIHGAHGYLIHQFLSGNSNKRFDRYGGSLANKNRFLMEIIGEIREQVGPEYPLVLRLSIVDYLEGGTNLGESLVTAQMAEAAGVDAISCSAGTYGTTAIIPPSAAARALYADNAAYIKAGIHIPVMGTGRINDPYLAEAVLSSGKADFVTMLRASLADPELPNKIRDGRIDEINYCIGCLQGCEAGLLAGTCATCLVNPRMGREYENPMDRTDAPKKVMVIGGGPAGLMAAETAAKIGHDVTVYEASGHLGGQFRSAAYPPGKGELSTFVSSLRKNLEDMQVPVKMETPVTEELLAAEKPDAVIIATGAKPLVPPIKGIDGANVVTAEDVLVGKADVQPGPVVVCGGGEVGGETAHFLTQVCQDITLVEMRDDILVDMFPLMKMQLMDYIREARIKVLTGARVSAITEEGVSYTDAQGVEQFIPAATVVSAFGYKAYNPLEEAAKKYCDNVKVVGCAVKAGNALTAVREGYEAALAL